jgi:hypothetical protein
MDGPANLATDGAARAAATEGAGLDARDWCRMDAAGGRAADDGGGRRPPPPARRALPHGGGNSEAWMPRPRTLADGMDAGASMDGERPRGRGRRPRRAEPLERARPAPRPAHRRGAQRLAASAATARRKLGHGWPRGRFARETVAAMDGRVPLSQKARMRGCSADGSFKRGGCGAGAAEGAGSAGALQPVRVEREKGSRDRRFGGKGWER